MNLENRKFLKKPEIVFVCIASFFGILSTIFMPILSVPDENQHFQVGYAIFSKNGRASSDLVLSEEIVQTAVRNGSYKSYFSKISSAKSDGAAINTNNYVFDGKTRASVFDLMRLPQAIGILIARFIYPSLGFMVLIGRLLNLTLFILSTYFIIKKVKYGKWAFVFIACIPMIIQQAASLSYDVMNLIAILAWVAFIINLSCQQVKITKQQLIIGTLLALFLLITKSNNILLFALLFVIPKKIIPLPTKLTKIRSSKHWAAIKYLTYATMIVIALIGFYIMSQKILAGHEFHPKKLLSVLLNTFYWGDLGLIDVTTIGIFGQFSNFYYHLPAWIVVLAFIILALIMLYENIPNISKRFAIISASLFMGSVLLISIGMYYGWAMRPVRLGLNANITDGIQGRYFTPLLVLLLPAFAYLQRYIKITTSDKNIIPIVTVVTSIILLATYLIQTYHFFWM